MAEWRKRTKIQKEILVVDGVLVLSVQYGLTA